MSCSWILSANTISSIEVLTAPSHERNPTDEEILTHALDSWLHHLGPYTRGANSRGIIHKSINPSHILYNRANQQVKFIGAGNASLLARETCHEPVVGVLTGDLAYMSPEQTGRMNRSIDVIARLLAKNAEDRHQSAHGLGRDLERSRDMARDGGIEPAAGEFDQYPIAGRPARRDL